MVAPRRKVHTVTRRETSRGITRRRYTRAGTRRNRLRVLTPVEINRQALPIDIESGVEPVVPPLLRNPAPFHGADSPTYDIIENPLPSDITLNNTPEAPVTTSVDPLQPTNDSDDDRSTIIFDDLSWTKDYDIIEVISAENLENINLGEIDDTLTGDLNEFNPLLTSADYDPLELPSEEPQPARVGTTIDLTLHQLINIILDNEEYNHFTE